jgi:hypothetical protein
VSTLHLAIPALEALHRAWSSRAERPKYERFFPALEAAYKKIDNYYEKTTKSPAYVLAMSMWSPFMLINYTFNILLVLNPKEKMSYFEKHWSTELQSDVKKCVEELVRNIFSWLLRMLSCLLVQKTVSAIESRFGFPGICGVEEDEKGDSYFTS